ncbi:hypothetical protein Fmac_011982 [Flemingia macrophylla]|uniref:Pectinesterase n=1 Tax=Flemingia macrophylla TaxID=520843 RepID=A0ABD1MP15_9FABA
MCCRDLCLLRCKHRVCRRELSSSSSRAAVFYFASPHLLRRQHCVCRCPICRRRVYCSRFCCSRVYRSRVCRRRVYLRRVCRRHEVSQTPNPQPCEYFLTSNPTQQYQSINDKSDFLKLSLQLAQERALKGHANTLLLGTKCRDPRETAAWPDCVEFYEQTIHKLNKTLDPNIKCSQVDTQTWLSTALTNLETCKAGFYELGVEYQEPSYKDGFPTWVKPGDRKLLQASSSASKANVVVAKDGSGKYMTVSAAINAAPKSSSGRTIITGSKSVGGGVTTFRSATVAVVGDRFIAQDITFRNTAGAANHQAVALRSGSDLSVFYRCSFEGYQDTLYVYSDRQFYRECDIYGTVDFIFGNASVVFQNCNLYARNPPNKVNTITAQGRTDPNMAFPFTIQRLLLPQT